MGFQTEFSVVLSQSKKIQKIPRSDESAKQKPRNSKKYKTFDSGDKKRIISGLKKSLTDLKLTKQETSSLSSGELLEILESLSVEDFNAVLNNTLSEHVEAFKSNIKSLRRWRRRIKEWITSSEKPETRGNLLIPQEKLGLFKEHLIPEIQQMQSRNLKLLREKLPSIFKKIDHPIKKQTCSKNWWYSFLDKNSEIKSLWDSLPKRRNVYDLSDQSKSDFDSPEEMGMEMVFGTGLLFSEQNEGLEEHQEMMREADFFFPFEETKEERADMFIEADPFMNQEDEIESLVPALRDIMINPQAFQHEMVIEELQRWKSCWTEEIQEDPVSKYFEREPVQATYRNHFFQEKEDIVSLLEAALEMEISPPKKGISFI